MTDTNLSFIIYPAIDMRAGQVVRLIQGDPARQTTFSNNPGEMARRWFEAGATWLHVVNLDGAFEEGDDANRAALAQILTIARSYNAQVQFGGGLRSLAALEQVLQAGVRRAILGPAAVQHPDLLADALRLFGPERIAAGLDARQGFVQVRGWQETTLIPAGQAATDFAHQGLRWLIFTDTDRDGTGRGLNLAATIDLARQSGLAVIASGGVNNQADIEAAQQAGLAGVIAGRALYDGRLVPKQWNLTRKQI